MVLPYLCGMFTLPASGRVVWVGGMRDSLCQGVCKHKYWCLVSGWWCVRGCGVRVRVSQCVC